MRRRRGYGRARAGAWAGAALIAVLAAAGGTLTPGPDGPRPDLVLAHADSVRQDRLVVVANAGAAAFSGPIMVVVNDGASPRVDVVTPLRPGEALEAVLNTEYVQRRARVLVVISATPEGSEVSLANNRLEGIVGPNQPLDLELAAAVLDAGDGHLVVTVRSGGPIPLGGTVTISVRESPPSNRLLAAGNEPLDVAAGGTQRFEFPSLVGVDLTTITISIATDAIVDADTANDSYRR